MTAPVVTGQHAMNTRRMARRQFMKRIARRKPLLDEPTISKAFREVSVAGDQLTLDPTSPTGWIAYGKFHYENDRDRCVIVYVKNDGTFEPLYGSSYHADLEQFAAAVN